LVTAGQIQEYLESRRQSNKEPFEQAREALLTCNKSEVLCQFQQFLKAADEDDRCWAIEGLFLLYGTEATDAVLPLVNDRSSNVRWVICDCLVEYGDNRAAPALIDRMKVDPDCQVRGTAANALGHVGVLEHLPQLYAVTQSDAEEDQLGYSPSCQAFEAITSILRRWVIGKLSSTQAKTFERATAIGRLQGKVTAEAIPFDAEGRINRTARYAHLPRPAFGFGWMSKLNLETTLAAPFEVAVEYADPSCVIQRMFVFHRIEPSDDCNWAVDTIVDSAAIATLSGSGLKM
jgi:hypothetical protein